MNRHTVAAPTALMAMGRKMMVLAVFSLPGESRSARIAMSSPRTMDTAGTMMIQSRLLQSVCRKSAAVEQGGKFFHPTNLLLSSFLKLSMMVWIVG